MILIVIANPNSKSFSFSILSVLQDEISNAQQDFEVIDLYRDEHKQNFYSHSDKKSVLYYQEKISSADEIVFIHPIYWSSPPAILKNFLEQNFREGFAYKYSEKDEYLPLLGQKRMRLVVTSNESEEVYKEAGDPYKVVWEEFSLGTGMEIKDIVQIGNMRGNLGERELILENLRLKFSRWY